MEQLAIWEAVRAGGDVAMVAVFFLIWRLDRRLVRIEAKINGH